MRATLAGVTPDRWHSRPLLEDRVPAPQKRVRLFRCETLRGFHTSLGRGDLCTRDEGCGLRPVRSGKGKRHEGSCWYSAARCDSLISSSRAFASFRLTVSRPSVSCP